MADNYLEKKYDEFLHGRNVVRKVNPTLDGLLGRLAAENKVEDSGYLVKQAQLDAVVRSASLLALDVEFETDEARAEIRLRSTSAFALGQAALACRLKAAELHLGTEVRCEGSDTQVFIRLFRYRSS
jgi:hypothetical protein